MVSKVFGFSLSEKWGVWAFICWVVGFYCAFMPLYILGLNGFMRRTSHYTNTLFQPFFILASIGALLILCGIVLQITQLIVSFLNQEKLRDVSGDPWNGRTLEWSVSSPAPLYNFAVLPTVKELDQYWVDKTQHPGHLLQSTPTIYEPIHMPKNTGAGFIIAIFAGIMGFAVVWHMWLISAFGLAGMIVSLIARTFVTDTDYYVDATFIKNTEMKRVLT